MESARLGEVDIDRYERLPSDPERFDEADREWLRSVLNEIGISDDEKQRRLAQMLPVIYGWIDDGENLQTDFPVDDHRSLQTATCGLLDEGVTVGATLERSIADVQTKLPAATSETAAQLVGGALLLAVEWDCPRHETSVYEPFETQNG